MSKTARRGFILIETLMAAVFIAIFLPILASRFADYLRSAIDLRQRQEAARIAISCMEAVESFGSAPGDDWTEENLSPSLTDCQVEIEAEGSSQSCTVTVRWRASGGEREFVLTRRIR